MENKEYCKHCYRMIEEGSSFCPNCGKPIATNIDPMIYCPNCGKGVKGRVSFCPSCGARMAQPEQFSGQGGTTNVYTTVSYNSQPSNVSDKNKWITFLLAFLVGWLGVHRFYVGKIGSGVAWLLTGGVFGIGWFIDWIMILCDNFTDGDGRKIVKEK